MRAVQLNERGALEAAVVEVPVAGPGEVLIEVHAAGITRPELLWYPTTHTADGAVRRLAIPGHEFFGTVAAMGEGANGFSVGDRVYGMNDWFQDGATAEYCLTSPTSIALSPQRLTPVEAATVPIGALTAFQGLFEQASLQPGERVLVHGAAGAVGLFAVQFAHLHGAHVLATVSAGDRSFVRGLGADEAIDYKASRFEDVAGAIDVVFDCVGGEIRNRSRAVLKTNGRLVSIAEDDAVTRDASARAAFFIVKPNQEQLTYVAKLLDEGTLRTFVKAVVPLEQAPQAYAGELTFDRNYGKVVVAIQ